MTVMPTFDMIIMHTFDMTLMHAFDMTVMHTLGVGKNALHLRCQSIMLNFDIASSIILTWQ